MNFMVFTAGNDIFKRCECIQGFAFKMVATRANSAHLTAAFAQLQDKSVYLTTLNASHHIHTS